MTQDTNTASGAADLPEALKHAEGLESFAEHLPAYGFDSKPLKEAAATIRRLHALLEAEDAAHCNTIEQRDEAEKLGTMLANAVAEHFRVEVGEYSNLNDPRLVALEILGGGYITDSDADRKIAALAAGQATAAQQGAAYAAQDSEHQMAIMQGERNASLDAYSRVVYLTGAESRLYEAGFTNGWDRRDRLASHGQAPASKIEGLTAAQESLGVEFEKVLHDNLFDLYEESAPHGQAPAQAAPAAVAGPSDAEPLHITHGPLMRHAAYLLRSRKPAWPEHESVAAELELAADGHPTPAGKPSPEWLEVAEAAMRAAAPTTQPAPQQEASPTAGMNIAQRILHVGGRNNAAGYVEFGSIQAVEALVRQVLRDLPSAPQPSPAAQGDALDAARLDWLRDNSCDLRCVDSATGQGDGDIHWIVIEHHMTAPVEREIGRAYRDDPRAAIDAARAAHQEGEAP